MSDDAGCPGLRHEIIVALDACTDATESIARDRGCIVASHDRRQISATRNLGARHARGDVLLFVDADTRVSPGVVRESLDLITAGCVGGGALPDFDGALPWHARVSIGLFRFALGARNKCGGAYLFSTRAAFNQSGGFNETVYAAEELYFILALKRIGRFRLTKSRVLTSGRKLRTHSAGEIYGFFLRAMLTGPRIVRDRKHLDLWYGPRREDPHVPGS
ncbi:MAG: glycosyltransferase [Phycisphaerae bacterium]|nr:glycosyltransferase [Phycisphaerae bacterium]